MSIRALICEDEPLARETLRDFIAASPDLLLVGEATNGTIAYLPALAGYAFFGVVALVHGSPAGWYCIACAVILFAGFVFRAIDQDICLAFPLGTHFMWHVLIALMLSVNLMAVAKYGAPRRPAAGHRR